MRGILAEADTAALIERLDLYRWVGTRYRGRRGFGLESMLRATILSYLLKVPCTAELTRRLQDQRKLRKLCGFKELPHRTTFSRFFGRLARHKDLVENCIVDATNRLREHLPGLGSTVAVDSTVVRSYSNPRRRVVSDQEASWTAKTSSRPNASNGKEWSWGYKLHALADAAYGIPLWGFLTTAKVNDSPELPRLLDQVKERYDWFAPEHVVADKGYDSQRNHREIMKHGAIPVIPIRKNPKGNKLQDGLYTDEGAPTCIGQVPMEYVKSDPKKGDLYRCPPGGCHLKDRKGVRHCQDEVWEKYDREDNPRLFGLLRRGSELWNQLYSLRMSVERVFKSMKQGRRLEAHCLRGQDKIGLHAALSLLTFLCTALHRIHTGQRALLRWQTRRA